MAACEGLIIDIHEIAGSYSNTIVLEKRLVCGSISFQMVPKNKMTHHEKSLSDFSMENNDFLEVEKDLPYLCYHILRLPL